MWSLSWGSENQKICQDICHSESELLFEWHLLQVIFLWFYQGCKVSSPAFSLLTFPLVPTWFKGKLQSGNLLNSRVIISTSLPWPSVSGEYLLHLYHLFAPLLLLCSCFLAFEIYQNRYSSAFYTFSRFFVRIQNLPGLDLFSFYLLLESWYFSSLRPYMYLISLYATGNTLFFFF